MSELARIPLAGVIGSPIAHSKSPRLHGYWLNLYGIRGHYIPMDVAPGDLPDVIAALPKAGFVGCNVTIPHKEAAFALCDERDPLAARDRQRHVRQHDALVVAFCDRDDGESIARGRIVPDMRPVLGDAMIVAGHRACRGFVGHTQLGPF
mgnify:CR=1 FL=1